MPQNTSGVLASVKAPVLVLVELPAPLSLPLLTLPSHCHCLHPTHSLNTPAGSYREHVNVPPGSPGLGGRLVLSRAGGCVGDDDG